MSKRYKEAQKVGDLTKSYSLDEAVALLYKMPRAKFDETVELSARLKVDPKNNEHMVRGVLDLPNGSGRKVSVLVFTSDPQAALKAGADFAGLEDLMAKIQEGWLGFDVAVATPDAMKEVRKIARVLGPRGLMPTPKSGTVTDDVAEAIAKLKAGRVEFKMDKTANVGIIMGKRSFSESAIKENIKEGMQVLISARPASHKGVYIGSLTVSLSMSPGVELSNIEYSKV